ncbi:MAG: DUF721 domain-containing protein [Magnetococcales bacterium]|nr:DUF721 domain-containing protein [Magnetococcales bacterium]
MAKKRKSGKPVAVGSLIEAVAGRFLDNPRNRAMKIWKPWREAVGATLASHTEPTRLKEGTLTIRVDSPAWATQLSFLKPQLLQKLNSLDAKHRIKDIRFQTGTLTSRLKITRKKPPPPLPEALPYEIAAAQKLVEKIPHPPLKAVLLKMSLKRLIRKRTEEEQEKGERSC